MTITLIVIPSQIILRLVINLFAFSSQMIPHCRRSGLFFNPSKYLFPSVALSSQVGRDADRYRQLFGDLVWPLVIPASKSFSCHRQTLQAISIPTCNTTKVASRFMQVSVLCIHFDWNFLPTKDICDKKLASTPLPFFCTINKFRYYFSPYWGPSSSGSVSRWRRL